MALRKHNPPALNGRLAGLWYAIFPLLLSVLTEFCQFLLSVSFSALCVFSVSLSQCLLHTSWWLALPLPCSLSLTFFPLCSSLQRREKRTCQIQVGHHTISHPHQLLSTRCLDANKFFQSRHVVLCSSSTVRYLSETVNATAVQCQCPCDRAA